MNIIFSWILTIISFILPILVIGEEPSCLDIDSVIEITVVFLMFVPFFIFLVLSFCLQNIKKLHDKTEELERYIKLLRSDINDSSKKD